MKIESPAAPNQSATKTRWAWTVATFFGAGFGKPGPGTWGSVATVLLWALFAWAAHPTPQILLYGLFLLIAFALFLGIPAATIVARESGRKDPQFVVIDEVAGQAITLNQSLWPIMAGLALIAAGTFIEQAIATGFIGVAARHAKSTAVGLYVTCYYIGGALGGILPGGIWHHFGWPGCMALCAIVQLIMLAVVLRYWGESAPGSA